MQPAPPRPPGRVAIIGDLAGQLDELCGELERLGAVDDRLPDDLTVVQVGDLVHRGPASEGVVALVDRYLRDQPAQWRQLAGNHEAQYLAEPAFDWPEHLDHTAADTLAGWWASGAMRPAVALEAAGERLLVTHAGLTSDYWRDVLDAQPDVTLVAAALNSFAGTHDAVLFAAGHMLGGGAPRPERAGPLWAAAATELLPSWLHTPLPFSQVHGHSSPVDWRRKQLRADADVARVLGVDLEAAHTEVSLPGGRIVGVDPGHGAKPHRPWRAFVLEDARVLG
ncbi:metallophosphoesterase family protein [Jatrophihabitans fulvus]